MYTQQAIPHPTGVSVFGSYLLKVDPDRALVRFRVSRTHADARKAFAATREASDAVRAALEPHRRAGADVRVSAITLQTAFDGYGAAQKVVGQRATVSFSVALMDVVGVEATLTDVVAAGVNVIDGVDLHTSRMKELRATARRGAVAAAREKAELYASAAGVQLGALLHIEDTDPTVLTRRGGHGEDLHASHLASDDDVQGAGPGSITVAAAVHLSFAIL